MPDKKLITFWAPKIVHVKLEALAAHENKKKSQLLRDLIHSEFSRLALDVAKNAEKT